MMSLRTLGLALAALVLVVSSAAAQGVTPASGNLLSSPRVVSGVLKLPDGTVGAPSLTFTNDTDLGLYRKGANVLGLAASYVETSGNIRLPNATGLVGRNAADSADVSLIMVNTSGRVVIGASTTNVVMDSGFVMLAGVTSSFPALKRSSTELQVRLADDSAYAPLAARNVSVNGILDLLTSEARIRGIEISDPAAPASNTGVLYFRDNGSGKTQLVARFPTGAVQVIVTEP